MDEKLELVDTIVKYAPNLINGIHKAAEYFQSGEENKGADLVIQITEGIDWITRAVLLTEEIHEQAIDLDCLNEKLSEIIEAFKNEDYILIGDLLEYEIIPILDEIQNRIK